MGGKLVVSDASQGLVALLTLPDFTQSASRPMSFRPGCLAGGAALYCADASEPVVYRLEEHTLQVEAAYAMAPEIEGMILSLDGGTLYALSGGADSLAAMDTAQGHLRAMTPVGMRPRAISLDSRGQCLAVACGSTCQIKLLEGETLAPLETFPVDGPACGVCFFAGQIMALCTCGEYDMGTVVGAIGRDGKWTPWRRLPGMPGGMAPCGGGLLVGHMNSLTMLDAPNGRIRWQTAIAGLPGVIVPVGRMAAFADGLEGLVGLVDIRKGRILRRMMAVEPVGLAVTL